MSENDKPKNLYVTIQAGFSDIGNREDFPEIDNKTLSHLVANRLVDSIMRRSPSRKSDGSIDDENFDAVAYTIKGDSIDESQFNILFRFTPDEIDKGMKRIEEQNLAYEQAKANDPRNAL